MKIKLIDDMKGRVPMKYAVLTVLIGAAFITMGIMNFHQAYQTIPQSLPLPICR